MPQIIGTYDREDGQYISDQKPVTGTTLGTKRALDTTVFSRFGLNNYAVSGSTEYVGKEDARGEWLVMKIVTSGSNMTLTYATTKNNPTYTSYNDAWGDRTLLTYSTFAGAY